MHNMNYYYTLLLHIMHWIFKYLANKYLNIYIKDDLHFIALVWSVDKLR